MNYSITAPSMIDGEIDLPASKSISNRVLIINALSGDRCEIRNLAQCDDTLAMINALSCNDTVINIGAAGTAMRFLTAYFSLQDGRTVVLDGSERMRRRPIKPLVAALNACGADIRYVDEEGFPPIEIHGRNYRCRSMTIDAAMSSQFISALLMIAPIVGCEKVNLVGGIISRPYIDMTLGVMNEFGIETHFNGSAIQLHGVYNPPADFLVENDWSAASYWFALQSLQPDSHISLRGLFDNSLQGDARMCKFYKCCFGVDVKGRKDGSNVIDLYNVPLENHGFFEKDLSDNPDLAQTIAVAACLHGFHFRLTGLQTLRIKETDRIEALRSQLLKLGYEVEVGDNYSLCWNGRKKPSEERPVIETFDDHRMAMAFAPASVLFKGLVIADVDVVSKSYPDFWKHLALCGFELKEMEL